MADSSGAGAPLSDGAEWDRVADLFERILASSEPEVTVACEPDHGIRSAAEALWQHHISADKENYLASPIEITVTPTLNPGQRLLNRFHVEKMLGTGGMGEVYLAWDERMESRVALKTIARLLAPSRAIRKRFTAEVQSARRVTHPSVCRIHELFEDGETVFFSMEYLEGTPLTEVIAGGCPLKLRKTMACQLAEGLHAAHQTGVVHGDFKPANVMVVNRKQDSGPPVRAIVMDFGLARALDGPFLLSAASLSFRAGTIEYMAPELQAGGAPTVRSDIFAFGKVARELLPDEHIWDECTNPSPEARPESLEKIIRGLNSRISRRYWAGGLAVVAAGAAFEAVRLSSRPAVSLPVGARILVNRFRSVAAEMSSSRLARAVLLTALQQSPRLQPIADQELLPALRQLEPDSNLPLGGKALLDLVGQLRAAFWIDGDLRQSGGRYSLDVRLMSPAASQLVAASSFHDAPAVIALAQMSALWLRKIAGESARSLASNPTDVSAYTSEIPEALQKYYEALEHYAVAEMDQAVPLLEEAIRLDPLFAQAHQMLGVAVNALRRYDEGYRAIDTAMSLAGSKGLPERERSAIETSFYRMTEDPWKTIEAAKRNITYHPAEPRAYASLGQALVNAGNAAESVLAFREAVKLAPADWMQVLPLQEALVEAGEFSLALEEFQAAVSRGITDRWIHNGAGSAYMGLEQYDAAASAFSKEPLDASNVADLQGPRIMRGELRVALAAMEEQRARARNPIELHQANQYLCGLYFATDRVDAARQTVREMAELPPYPPMARKLAGTASWACRLGADETLAKVAAITGEIARKWPNALTTAEAMHANALVSWRRNALEEAENLLLKSAGSAFGIWTLFDVAEFFTRVRKWDLAEAYWEKFESHRGTVLVKVWCPVVFVLSWLYRAAVAQARGDRPKALQYSQKVLDHWSRSGQRLQIIVDAENINMISKTL